PRFFCLLPSVNTFVVITKSNHRKSYHKNYFGWDAPAWFSTSRELLAGSLVAGRRPGHGEGLFLYRI
ncbi:MAG TPA: hypothetical protein VK498_16355, partial [Ferruginibacter sp.]|nr:hypothetical protein [Ferruginibacter sp.]